MRRTRQGVALDAFVMPQLQRSQLDLTVEVLGSHPREAQPDEILLLLEFEIPFPQSSFPLLRNQGGPERTQRNSLLPFR